jgi:hypothetical protein
MSGSCHHVLSSRGIVTMRLLSAIFLTSAVSISVGVLATTGNCFYNAPINTCEKLLPDNKRIYPSGTNCLLPQSNNTCDQSFRGASGMQQSSPPSSHVCTVKYGTKNPAGDCIVPSDAVAVNLSVQCETASGQACGN